MAAFAGEGESQLGCGSLASFAAGSVTLQDLQRELLWRIFGNIKIGQELLNEMQVWI